MIFFEGGGVKKIRLALCAKLKIFPPPPSQSYIVRPWHEHNSFELLPVRNGPSVTVSFVTITSPVLQTPLKDSWGATPPPPPLDFRIAPQ